MYKFRAGATLAEVLAGLQTSRERVRRCALTRGQRILNTDNNPLGQELGQQMFDSADLLASAFVAAVALPAAGAALMVGDLQLDIRNIEEYCSPDGASNRMHDNPPTAFNHLGVGFIISSLSLSL